MASLSNFLDYILTDEGRTLDKIPGDRGGLTFCGISQVAWPNLELWALLKSLNVPLGSRCEAAMPKVQEFYNKNYWQPLRGDEIGDQAYANKLGSDMVNMGAITAIKLAQEALNAPQTGKVDDITIQAINA